MSVLRHSSSGVVCLAHFDGSGPDKLVDKIESMVKRVKEVNHSLAVSDGQFELHLIGGFNDSRHYSEELVLSLLSEFPNVINPVDEWWSIGKRG